MTRSSETRLLEPYSFSNGTSIRNRVVMQSMTRNRCIESNFPGDAVVQHYRDRAKHGVGLIITEGTFIWLNGAQWLHAPVMFTEEHADAWKRVTDAVHVENGKVFMQAWHAGRQQNENMPMLKKAGYPVLAPSKIVGTGGNYKDLPGFPDHTTSITEITNPLEIVEQYRASVTLAKSAGFDGIEVLAQGGYLLQNFLHSCSNMRQDRYGGSTENRCRFVLEVIDAILEVWEPSAVGIKICPTDNIGDMTIPYQELSATYTHLVGELVARNIGFINLSRRGTDVKPVNGIDFQIAQARPAGTELPKDYDPLEEFGPLIKFPGSKTALMVNHEYGVGEAEGLLREDKIDLAGFGRPFIHNPDLITRIHRGVPFALNDRGGRVYYGPYSDPNEGYNDWPVAGVEGRYNMVHISMLNQIARDNLMRFAKAAGVGSKSIVN